MDASAGDVHDGVLCFIFFSLVFSSITKKVKSKQKLCYEFSNILQLNDITNENKLKLNFAHLGSVPGHFEYSNSCYHFIYLFLLEFNIFIIICVYIYLHLMNMVVLDDDDLLIFRILNN